MKICLVTPAGKQSRAGNRTTADRWAKILKGLGHRVSVVKEYDGSSADLMIAIHAWRSYESIRNFSDKFPERPLIVLLAGTDIYSFQHTHPEETIDSMERATVLISLHNLVHQAIPKKFSDKLNLIYQSALPLTKQKSPTKRYFDVCVVGHLRDEKDSLRAAYAARELPLNSRLRIIHLGKAHNKKWSRLAREEELKNHRFKWRGEVAGWEVRHQYRKSHALVISSVMEGGANVVSEALASGLPIIASKIDGNVGLLGKEYFGYYPVQNTKALTHLLLKAETDPKFLTILESQCRAKSMLFYPERERDSWKTLLGKLN